jgi:S-adenosylmethionine synthetase
VIVDTREAIKEIGYNDPDRRFNAAGVSVLNLFNRQARTLPVVWTMGTTLVQLCRPERG